MLAGKTARTFTEFRQQIKDGVGSCFTGPLNSARSKRFDYSGRKTTEASNPATKYVAGLISMRFALWRHQC
jgi:hypothetical protein